MTPPSTNKNTSDFIPEHDDLANHNTKPVPMINHFTAAIIHALYYRQFDSITDENIDAFYGYLGYDLELASDMENLIPNTSTLRKIIEDIDIEFGHDS